MRRLILIAMFGLSACVSDQPPPAAVSTVPSVAAKAHLDATLSKSQQDVVEASIKEILKDPDSAKFGKFVATTMDGIYSVCGYVNSKNSFGGYVGMMPFVGILGPLGSHRFTVIALANDDVSVQATQHACATAGISI